MTVAGARFGTPEASVVASQLPMSTMLSPVMTIEMPTFVHAAGGITSASLPVREVRRVLRSGAAITAGSGDPRLTPALSIPEPREARVMQRDAQGPLPVAPAR